MWLPKKDKTQKYPPEIILNNLQVCVSASDILNVASTVLNIITEPLEDALNELLEPIMDSLKKHFPSKKLR